MRRALAFAVVVLIGAAPAAFAACPVPANADQIHAEVADRMNAERRERGLRPLSFSPKLAHAAARQACDMALNGVRSHRGSDGVSFVQRVRAVGGCGPGGENIAWGQRSAASVISWWMNSPGHRANILHRRAATYGIAVASAGGSPSWVMVVGGNC